MAQKCATKGVPFVATSFPANSYPIYALFGLEVPKIPIFAFKMPKNGQKCPKMAKTSLNPPARALFSPKKPSKAISNVSISPWEPICQKSAFSATPPLSVEIAV